MSLSCALRAGFAKADITPRIGVELCGFGPYLNRHSVAVRDRLWARAMAVSNGETTLVLLSCDLISLTDETTRTVRRRVREATGITDAAVMLHCTHTHSGPATAPYIGWGDMDAPYMELLPGRLVRAAVDAVAGLQPVVFGHAVVPCEGIGYNREHDRRPTLEEALSPDWRPERPELTDTTCHVIRADNAETGCPIGFLSYFGCHPVVCCAESRHIHGDYAGVATNLVEKEFPGSVGLFLQGAQGDVNSCVVHHPEAESLEALDVIAARYAASVRNGLRHSVPLEIMPLGCELRRVSFGRQELSVSDLRRMLDEKEAVLRRTGASDDEREVRLATVYVHALRRLVGRMEVGTDADERADVQGLRLGALTLVGAPFEIFQQIKNDVTSRAPGPVTLVLGITNGSLGYAPDRETARRGGYAATQVPFMLGSLPFSNVHDELTEALLVVAEALHA